MKHKIEMLKYRLEIFWMRLQTAFYKLVNRLLNLELRAIRSFRKHASKWVRLEFAFWYALDKFPLNFTVIFIILYIIVQVPSLSLVCEALILSMAALLITTGIYYMIDPKKVGNED